MSVQRVWEAPRVTKPYTEEQWAAVEKLGHAVDADLAALDVRLTMGGEPTFVASDDPDGEEWNTAALGKTKRARAAELYHRLKAEYAPTGLAHFGQGKWYPGEPLPRWSLNCFWRRDGEPIWERPELLANEKKNYGATALLAERFLAGVAQRLGLSPAFVFAAYEDAFYYMWKERRLPSNVDPFDSRLTDKVERARLARIFEQGLHFRAGTDGRGRPRIAGLPEYGRHGLADGPVVPAPGALLPGPGDSPLGLRLPLDSLPWARPGDIPYVSQPDLTQIFPPLPQPTLIRQQLKQQRATLLDSASNLARDPYRRMRHHMTAPTTRAHIGG